MASSDLTQIVSSFDLSNSVNLEAAVSQYIKNTQLIENAEKGLDDDGYRNHNNKMAYHSFLPAITELCRMLEAIFERSDFQGEKKRSWIIERVLNTFKNSTKRIIIENYLLRVLAVRPGEMVDEDDDYPLSIEASREFRSQLAQLLQEN